MQFSIHKLSKLFHVLFLLMPGLVLCLTLPFVENLDFCLGVMGHNEVEVPRAMPRMVSQQINQDRLNSSTGASMVLVRVTCCKHFHISGPIRGVYIVNAELTEGTSEAFMPWYMENRECPQSLKIEADTQVLVMASLSAAHPGIQFPEESLTVF